MKPWLLLATAGMTGTAAADGFTATARAGGAYVMPDSGDRGLGFAGGVEGGYAFGRLRPSLALDVTRFNTSEKGETLSYLLESVTAKLQVDLIADVVFAFAAAGATADSGDQTRFGFRFQLGLGGRYWLDHDDAVRFDASYAREAISGDAIGEVGATLGYEHYF